jgi:anaerobic ribonucleoside-triphosphate reductase activating protein
MKTEQKEETTLRVHALDLNGSASDGPGIRAVVFLQGCDRHCKGCHNPTTWALDGGKAMPVDEVVDRVVASHIDRVTISGGEPLLQARGVLALIRKLKAKGIDDLCLYTGYSAHDVPHDISTGLRYLKTGEFRLEEKTTVKPYVGSRNQDFRRVA